MAGAMTAWVAEMSMRRPSPGSSAPETAAGVSSSAASRIIDRSLARVVDLVSPLTVACAVLAVSPDFDVFLHTHRTYSHSLGAAAIVWVLVALVAWRLRLPVVKTATICAAAYASHVLLDWLGRDDSRLAGPMALWPLTTAHFKSGADLFMEFTLLHKRHLDLIATIIGNAPALAREMLIIGVPFLLVMTLRLKMQRGSRREASLLEARPPDRLPGLSRARVAQDERG